MRWFHLVSALALMTLAAGCGGQTPTAPASATLKGLTITGVDAVLTGLSTLFTVTATFADGSSRSVTPTWRSSNPQVATVDSTGRVESRAHGTTILTASSEGQVVSKTVHVVNNFAGTWAGSFVVN